MVDLEKVLIRLETDLRELRLRWALIGGVAVSARAEPRTTRDLDVAVAVEDDREAEKIIAELRARGYGIEALLEHEATGRLATVRLLAPGTTGVIVDLLFASSGLEPEVVESAELLEALPGLEAPIARIGPLLALKVLAGRPKDLADIDSLLLVASHGDLETARELLELVSHRGFARNQDLSAAFANLMSRYSGI